MQANYQNKTSWTSNEKLVSVVFSITAVHIYLKNDANKVWWDVFQKFSVPQYTTKV